MNVCTIVERLWPTVMVPGINRSLTTFLNLYQEVVCAYEPMPSVSKKFVTIPTPSCSAVGNRRSVAGLAGAPDLAADRPEAIAFPHRAMKPALKAASAARRALIGFIRNDSFHQG